MQLISFEIKHIQAFKSKIINLDNNVNIFFSEKNSTGKTTLMRAILFTLGFQIPNTELVNFNDYEFLIKLHSQNADIEVYRLKNLLKINGNEYDLPSDTQIVHSLIFGTNNSEILANILGTIYFDQEKGWTLLNRGTIIGENRFNIESFFRGLKDDESDDSYRIVAKIKAIDKKITQYKMMLDITEYQASLKQNVDKSLDFKTVNQEIEESILSNKMKLQTIEEEIESITNLIKKNKNFADYISSKKIYIKNPINNSPIRVTKDILLNYDDLENINIARKSFLVAERNKLKKEIFDKEQLRQKETNYFNINDIDKELTEKFSSMQSLDPVQVKAILDRFQKEKKELKSNLISRTKNQNDWISKAYTIIEKYFSELKLNDEYKVDVFTSNLKAKSGAILHKMIFIYKITYIKLLSEKLGYPLPIFCDSPNGREIEQETINEMLQILKRDFNNHQIIIATIFNYQEIFNNSNIISIDKTLFNKQTIFD